MRMYTYKAKMVNGILYLEGNNRCVAVLFHGSHAVIPIGIAKIIHL